MLTQPSYLVQQVTFRGESEGLEADGIIKNFTYLETPGKQGNRETPA